MTLRWWNLSRPNDLLESENLSATLTPILITDKRKLSESASNKVKQVQGQLIKIKAGHFCVLKIELTWLLSRTRFLFLSKHLLHTSSLIYKVVPTWRNKGVQNVAYPYDVHFNSDGLLDTGRNKNLCKRIRAIYDRAKARSTPETGSQSLQTHKKKWI